MNSSGYLVHEIDSQTWRLEDSIKAYSYLLEGSEAAMLIDTGTGFGDLLKVVKSLTNKPILVINTHGHFDHIGFNYQFDNVYISREDEPVLKEHMDPIFRRNLFGQLVKQLGLHFTQSELDICINLSRTEQVNYVHDGEHIDLGGRSLEVISTPGHTPGSICLLEKEKSRLYTADTVCAWGILLSLNHSCSVRTFRDSILKLESRKSEFNLLLPGHHEVPVDTEYLKDYRICAEKIMSRELIGTYIEDLFGSGWKAENGRVLIAYRKDNID